MKLQPRSLSPTAGFKAKAKVPWFVRGARFEVPSCGHPIFELVNPPFTKPRYVYEVCLAIASSRRHGQHRCSAMGAITEVFIMRVANVFAFRFFVATETPRSAYRQLTVLRAVVALSFEELLQNEALQHSPRMRYAFSCASPR